MASTPPDPLPHYPATRLAPHQNLIAPIFVWSILAVLLAIALVDLFFLKARLVFRDDLAAILLLAAAAAALVLAVRRVRGRIRIADGFYPLVLLNPLLYRHIRPVDPLDTTLIAAGLLGLMTAAVVAMKRNNPLRYVVVAAFALALTALSNSFLMLLPALVAWLIYTGYSLARSSVPGERVRGLIIMALGEILLLFFGLACLLEEPSHPPVAATLFSTILGFRDFPLIVLAIIMLALGWRKGPHENTPPHFAGMLALLVGLLTLLLNNFQYGSLPAPGTDQTVLEICIVYTVFALHGPRRLQWIVPPMLLLAAVTYTFFW